MLNRWVCFIANLMKSRRLIVDPILGDPIGLNVGDFQSRSKHCAATK